jgi:hypothetical protein
MPPLKNQKHENFANLIVHGARNGWTQGECYQRAGYRASGHAAEVAASRLLKNVDIQGRRTELAKPATQKTQITAESLIADLDRVIEGASQSSQWSSVNRAIELRGKLKGFLVDRIEIGKPGDFAACGSFPEIIVRLLEDVGDDAPAWLAIIDQMREAIVKHTADRAIPVRESHHKIGG